MDIITRAKNLILQPAAEWRVIAAEPATTASLFQGYAIPMAAVPVVVGLISQVAFLRRGIVFAIIAALVGYLLSLLGVWILGKVVQLLAPRFGGTADEVPAMKLAVYASTGGWVAGIVAFIPFLGGIIALLGMLYNLYLFYLGSPVVTRVAADQVVIFLLVILAVMLVLYFLLVGVVGGAIISTIVLTLGVGLATVR